MSGLFNPLHERNQEPMQGCLFVFGLAGAFLLIVALLIKVWPWLLAGAAVYAAYRLARWYSRREDSGATDASP